MRDDDITIMNFGTGLWGVSNVVVRRCAFSGDIDIVDAGNNSNRITISADTVRAIVNAANNN